MKTNLLIVIILSGFLSQIIAQGDIELDNSQKNYFSAFLKLGVSTQIHSYPNVMNYDNVQLTTDVGNRNFLSEEEYGKFGEGFLPILGFGINYTYSINSFIFFRPQLTYIQKGCSYRGHVLIENTGNSTTILVGDMGEKFKYNNRFHYLTGDLLLIFKINKWKTKPYIQTGLRNELLVIYNIDYDIDQFSSNQVTFGLFKTSYPNNTNYKDFNRLNFGMVNGFGLEFKKRWYIELDTNFDFGYVVKNTDLKVRNLISTFTVGIGL